MKKMNKKGFTLIELLAIIVILAIIAVITVPIILDIIDNARKGAEKNSVIGYGKAVELAYTQAQYDTAMGVTTGGHSVENADNTKLANGQHITIGSGASAINLVVDFDGDKVVCSTDGNSIVDGKIFLTGCKVNGATTPVYKYGNGRACLASDASDTSCDAPAQP